MSRSKFSSIAIILCLIVLASSPAGLFAAGKSDFLGTVPADAIFCVRVNNLDGAVGALDQFLVGVAPVPPLNMMVRMQLAEALGDANMPGINMAGAFGLFAIAKDAENEPQVFLVAPVSDMKALLSSKAVGKADASGVSKITSQKMGGEGQVSMLPMGDFAIICPTEQYDGLIALAKPAPATASILSTLTPLEKTASTTAPLWARVNMVRINALFGSQMAATFEQMKNMPNPMAGGAPGANVAMNAYFDALLSLVKQSQAVNITLTPKPDSIALSTMIIAVPGSELATSLSLGTTPKGSPELGAYLQDGALANFYMKVNRPLWKKAYLSIFDLFANTAKEDSKKDMEKLKALITKSLDAMGDTAVMSMKGAPGAKMPFSIAYVVQIKDAKAMQECMKEGTGMMTTGVVADMYKASGMKASCTYTPNTATYNGFSIDTMVMSMKAMDVNSPEGKMISSMYGDGMNGRIARSDNMLLSYVGADADAGVKQLVDSYKAGGPKSGNAEFKAAMALVPDAANADFVGTYNYLRIFKTFGGLLPMPGISEALAKLPESKSNLIVAGRVAGGTLSMDVVLPKVHAQEIMGAVMQVQAGAMQQQPGGNGGPRRNKSKMPD